jgi:hypothetical protein
VVVRWSPGKARQLTSRGHSPAWASKTTLPSSENPKATERFVRTIKEQCLWSKLFEDTDDLRRGVGAFIEIYNNEWLIERLGHRTPRKAFIRTGTATPFSSHRKALDASDP